MIWMLKRKLKKLFEVEYFKNIGNKGDDPSPKTLTDLKGMIFKKRKPHNEVEEYFNTPTVEDSVCPLTWWRTNEYIFSKFKCHCPGFSCYSWNISKFRKGFLRRTSDDKRMSLSPESIRACTCMKSWLD
jgi:hypothetical protein